MSVFTENPVLQKELMIRFQLRRQSKANRIVIYTIIGLVIPLVYFFSIRSMVQDQNTAKDAFGIFVTVLEMSLVVLLTPAMTAGVITLEREKQTWNALLLSRLTHREIVAGKYVGAIVPTLVTLAVFFPLNVIAAVLGKVSLGVFVLAHLLLFATALFYGALGLFCSWACRRTQVSTAVSAGSVAAFVLGTPLAMLLWQTVAFQPQSGDPIMQFTPMWINPYAAMLELLGSNDMHPEVAVTCTALSLIGTIGLLTVVASRLAQGPKEMSA